MKIQSKQYAKALLESVSTENDLNVLIDNLEIVIENSKIISNILQNPELEIADTAKKITNLGIDKKISNLLIIISKNKDFSKLKNIKENLIKERISKYNILKAYITTANELNSSQKEQITKNIEKIFCKKIISNYIIDRKIINGILVNVGDFSIDLSVKSKMQKLKSSLS